MSTKQPLNQIDLNLAFQLLSLAGDVESFDTLQSELSELNIDNEQEASLRARAEFYKAIQDMLENELEAWDVAARFERGTLAEYTRQSNDPLEAQAILKVLDSVINMSMETYAQLDAVSIFAKEAILTCIRNNANDSQVEQGLRRFIRTAYTRIFCSHDVEKEHVVEHFPVIDAWRKLIDPKEVVLQAIEDIYELEELVGYDDYADDNEISEYFTCVLEKQIEMTSRTFVSSAYFEHHSESPAYAFLVANGAIDNYAAIEVDTNVGEMSVKTRKAITEYEKNGWWVSKGDIKNLAENIGKDGPDHLAVAIGRWCQEGKFRLITQLFKGEGTPTCNRVLARELISKVLAQKMQEEDVTFLASALALPLELVDASVSELAGFRLAQMVKHAGSISGLKQDAAATVSEELGIKVTGKLVSQTKPAKGGRKFVKISLDEFRQKIEDAFEKQEDASPRNLTSQVSKDLDKVDFDTENIVWDGSFRRELLGFHELENGLTFLGVQAGGDWEFPVFFIIYWDGKSLRGYIPTDGNPWNTDTKSAYGNDEERDLENARKRYPGVFDGVDYVDGGSFDFDINAIFADIQGRIVEK